MNAICDWNVLTIELFEAHYKIFSLLK